MYNVHFLMFFIFIKINDRKSIMLVSIFIKYCPIKVKLVNLYG